MHADEEEIRKLNRFDWRSAVMKSHGYGLLSPEAHVWGIVVFVPKLLVLICICRAGHRVFFE